MKLDFVDTTLMAKTPPTASSISNPDRTWVLSTLEPDQLVEAKKRPIPRRALKTRELLILWTLRLYLLFMMTVVAYQVWLAAR
jgi:hypothetical protein